MSHATVLIISKNNRIEKMMEPYWELNLSAEDKKKDERAVFEQSFLKEELEAEFQEWKEKNPELIEKYGYKNAKVWIKDWKGYILNKEETAYGYYHNPNAKWDWYVIGGRWSDRITLKTGEKVDLGKVKNIEPNCLKNLQSYAVLDENGWHEKSKLGWWGCSIYEKYCCIAEDLDIHEILKHFKYDYFRMHKNWKGYRNEYIENFIKTLHKYYYREGKKYILKNNLGNGKTEVTEELKREDFFRNMHWSKNFYKRFIKNLDPEMYLTFVDYHI